MMNYDLHGTEDKNQGINDHYIDGGYYEILEKKVKQEQGIQREMYELPISEIKRLKKVYKRMYYESHPGLTKEKKEHTEKDSEEQEHQGNAPDTDMKKIRALFTDEEWKHLQEEKANGRPRT